MPFVVLYDANVLYPSTLRDQLIRVAQGGLVQAKWTDQILDEVFHSPTANRPDLDPSNVVVSFPMAGTTEMLDYQASTFSMGGKYGKVPGGCVAVEIVERTLKRRHDPCSG